LEDNDDDFNVFARYETKKSGGSILGNQLKKHAERSEKQK
jgi:hypothetical protein